MPSGTRQTKRQFQPSITSFFAHRDRDVFLSEDLQVTRSPSLPAAIQSSLLNVGMRVRKSVPEGYKTTASDLDFEPHSMENQLMEISQENTNPKNPPYQFGSVPNELTPFCGIMKVGGLSSLPSSSIVRPLTEGPISTSISTSTQSDHAANHTLQTTPRNPHKRPFDDADDNAAGAIYEPFIWEDNDDYDIRPVSPRTKPVRHQTRLPDLSSLRPMAQPKTRRKDALPGERDVLGNVENARRGAVTQMDFEDAAFLQPCLEMELDGF